jgi:hypothetical protein
VSLPLQQGFLANTLTVAVANILRKKVVNVNNSKHPVKQNIHKNTVLIFEE